MKPPGEASAKGAPPSFRRFYIYAPVCDDFALSWKTTCSHDDNLHAYPASFNTVQTISNAYVGKAFRGPLSRGREGREKDDESSLGESQARERSDCCCSMADVWLDVQLQDFCGRQFNPMVFYFVGRVWRTEIPLLPNNFTERQPIIR